MHISCHYLQLLGQDSGHSGLLHYRCVCDRVHLYCSGGYSLLQRVPSGVHHHPHQSDWYRPPFTHHRILLPRCVSVTTCRLTSTTVCCVLLCGAVMGLLRGKKRSGKKGKKRGKASASSSDYSRVNSGASSVNGGAVSDGDSDSDDDDSDSGDGKSKAATLLTKIAEQKEVTRS